MNDPRPCIEPRGEARTIDAITPANSGTSREVSEAIPSRTDPVLLVRYGSMVCWLSEIAGGGSLKEQSKFLKSLD